MRSNGKTPVHKTDSVKSANSYFGKFRVWILLEFYSAWKQLEITHVH